MRQVGIETDPIAPETLIEWMNKEELLVVIEQLTIAYLWYAERIENERLAAD